jgi:hypothetical protein
VCDRASGACASPTPSCGQASFTPRHVDGDLLLVLDRSRSMSDRTPTGTKWTDLTGALDSVLTDTTEIKWGLSVFPASDTQACTVAMVETPPTSGSAGALSARIRQFSPTGAGTPTRNAVTAAGQFMSHMTDGARKYLLLATDGEPNCADGARDPNASDATATVATVGQLEQSGVSTFVVGVAADATADATLSSLARAGGEARQATVAYFPTTNARELETSLGVVARQVALCTFDLNPAPPVGDTISLAVGARPFPRNQAHTGDGWDFTNAGKSIALYGAACDAVQGGGAITAQYVCGTGSMCDGSTNRCVAIPGGGTGGTGGGGTGGVGGLGGEGGSSGGGGGGAGGSSGGTPGGMCRYNAQCGPGGICDGGMCMPACTSASDCGTGDACVAGHCMTNPNPPNQCTFNTDCTGGALCINQTCHPTCTTDANCTNPHDMCDHGVCQPDWRRIPSCTSNAQCAGGMACVDGVCRTPCWMASDCASSSSGSVCATGYCMRPNEASPQCFLNGDCGAGHNCVDATCQ